MQHALLKGALTCPVSCQNGCISELWVSLSPDWDFQLDVSRNRVCKWRLVIQVLTSLQGRCSDTCCGRCSAQKEGGKARGLPSGVLLQDLVASKTEAIPPTHDDGNPDLGCEFFETRQVPPLPPPHTCATSGTNPMSCCRSQGQDRKVSQKLAVSRLPSFVIREGVLPSVRAYAMSDAAQLYLRAGASICYRS